MKTEDFYTTYNARHLNPKEVAESFIWSTSFEKLIRNNHSVILGARGCGKTTLMKMLTLPALHNWKDIRAKEIKENIPFYGIYISTDIYWDVKNQTYGSQLRSFNNFSQIVSAFSVNSNVFCSLCDTFLNIIEFELEDQDDEKEIELAKHLAELWMLSDVIPKIHYIKEAINKRIDQVNQLIQEIIFNYKKDDQLPYYEYFNLSFETSLEVIIPIFERLYKIENKKKWALCFDELEFAPIWLQDKLFKSLRSRTQYLLYKLSASPILPLELEKAIKEDYSATSGNDVQIIKMWTSTDNEKFSRQIIDSLLLKKFNVKDSVSFFGTNDIYNKSADSYIEGSSFYKEILKLLDKDQSFSEFLSGRKINLKRPIPTEKSQKDTLFRKIKPVVYYRNFFIDKNKLNDNRILDINYRSRKTWELYSGIEVLTKICDGNPRWLIGVISAILAKSNVTGADDKIQFEELLGAARRFRNAVANIPIGPNSLTLENIIEKIGSYFQNQLLGKDFNMDPRGTFVVDENKVEIPENIVKLLEKGVAQGAFILLNCNDESFDFEIRGQRFKLSYLFCLLYKLPIRKYPSINLSECLKGVSVDSAIQISLF